jgi:acyl carrier protein
MSVASNELKLEIKNMIISTLGITDVDVSNVDDEKPLFGGGNSLTLDSVDAIEIIMAIQRNYGFRIADQSLAREVIRSINSIAQFIVDQRNGQNSR